MEAQAQKTLADPRAVVLVEGISDRLAVEALADRRGRDLAAEGISVIAMGGAHAIGRYVAQYGPQGLGVRLSGLCDAGEERHYRRSLERAGLGANLTRADLEHLGFYVCNADLEDELIRALGAARVEQVIESEGDLGAFRTLQKEPAWRGRPVEAQLHRFMKTRYPPLLVRALDADEIPRPLAELLAHI